MMQISGLGGVAAPAASRRRGNASGGFTLPAQPEAAEQAAPAAAAVGLTGMLALQETDCPAVRDRAARRHGQALLERLAALQRALLAGRVEASLLENLAALAGTVPEAADPGLHLALQAIALRARVELARLSGEFVATA